MDLPEGEGTNELLQAQTHVWNEICNYISSMSLKCAVELGIPDIIQDRGSPITLLELLTALSIPPTKSACLRRLMRLLVHAGFFTRQINGVNEEDVYFLTPSSRFLVKEKTMSMAPILLLVLDHISITPYHFMSSWFKGNDPTPLWTKSGGGFWELTDQNPKFNKLFDDAMASDTCILMKVFLGEYCHVFQGLRSLVDVGGGKGYAARAIVEAFPHVKCTVLDLPQVVVSLQKDEVVDFVGGDMFDNVPPADVVLLKWILHNWSDEDCVKILQRCKEAIPPREVGGKIIIIDMVVGAVNSHPKSSETQLCWDIHMMVLLGGAEREEYEWRKIFFDAGFTDYKITLTMGLRSVIELYP